MNAVRGMSAQEKANLIPYKIRHALAAKSLIEKLEPERFWTHEEGFI